MKRVGVVDSGGVVNLYGLWDWVGMAPHMGPESHSCKFPLGRPVSRKAGKTDVFEPWEKAKEATEELEYLGPQ